ncbi:hypothetical protein FRB96_005923 [Tulasnella sp. 330]|nr:hypothetical protein FRB96_005923 [Tulasnella sp. 330]
MKEAQLAACTCGDISIPGFTNQDSGASDSHQATATSLNVRDTLDQCMANIGSVSFHDISPLMSDFLSVDDLQQPPAPVLHTWHGNTTVSTTLWPRNIPPPELLHHLAETVFNAVPLATRIIHRPTFMASLALSPSSPAFPHASVLHAICALASLYTPIVADMDKIDLGDGMGSVVLNAGVFQRSSHEARGPFHSPDHDNDQPFNFAASHARWSREASQKALRRGEAVIEQVQSAILVTWFHHSRGEFVATAILVGSLTKIIAMLGFNTSSSYSPLSRIPSEYLYAGRPPLNTVEEETFRNIFWVIYAMERLVNATNVWTLSLDQDMLVTHPPLFTDSFTLYIKASVIFGQVRTFNRRYKQHYDLASMQSIRPGSGSWSPSSGSESTSPSGTAKARDPRETREFKALDVLIGAFIASIPQEFKDPVGLSTGARLDPTLYVAHLLPRMAMITLHDPHANVCSAKDSSAQKILTAAREILGLIYNVCGTAFDLLYLDHMSSTGWFLAGATLIRFLVAKTAQDDALEALILKEELNSVQFMLTNLGDRTGIGLRQLKLLDMVYKKENEAQARARSQPL